MGFDESVRPSPLFQPLPFLDVDRFSPWPRRLIGIDPWQKQKRDSQKVLQEYDEGWYRSLLEMWDRFLGEHDPAHTQPATVMRFFNAVTAHIADEVERNKAVYGSSQSAYLFSMGDGFMAGDFVLGSMIQAAMLVRYVDQWMAKYPVSSVVELGSGSGMNLFLLYYNLDIGRFVGGDICPNAIKLGNAISGTYGIPGNFQLFDFLQRDSLPRLVRDLDDYLLITCHALEQVQGASASFVDQVVSLANPPRMVLHFEPMPSDDHTLMGDLCRRYAEKNDYNLDYVRVIAGYQDRELLRVLDYKKRCFGLSAFNPTSFLCWEPRRQHRAG